jgi:Holliday junction resolvase
MSRRRGIERDRAVRDHLAGEDWFAVCSRGSHGAADILAIRAGSTPRVIQVKSTAGGPYERFGPADRAELAFAARLGGANALLAWWPPRGRLRWIPQDEWPT